MTTAAQPLSLDDGAWRVRRRDRDVRVSDCRFGRPDGSDRHPEMGGHRPRKSFAARRVPAVTADLPDRAHRTNRLELALRLPPRAHDADDRRIRSGEVL